MPVGHLLDKVASGFDEPDTTGMTLKQEMPIRAAARTASWSAGRSSTRPASASSGGRHVRLQGYPLPNPALSRVEELTIVAHGPPAFIRVKRSQLRFCRMNVLTTRDWCRPDAF